MKQVCLLIFVSVLKATGLLAQTSCATAEYYQIAIKADPSLVGKATYARGTATSIALDQTTTNGSVSNAALSIIKIPVVVHVLYNTDAQNISDDQIKSQIVALNQAFRHQHADTGMVQAMFKSLAADTYIEFELASTTPKGYATSGITRKKTSNATFGMDDKIKFSSQGGEDGWDSEHYLNIWVGNLVGGVNGYSSVLGGDKLKDGIVLNISAFGVGGSAASPTNKGRTAVHEVGHWLGLKHIWGDYYCGTDEVDDTPQQSAATRGCASGTVTNTCNGVTNAIMYNNYMDLTYDACTNMFTIGQRTKMRALFAEGGLRNKMLQTSALSGSTTVEPIQTVSLSTSVKLYPNPTKSQLTIEVSGIDFSSGTIASIYNTMGQLVQQVTIRSQITAVNLVATKPGMYVIKFAKQPNSYKFVVN
ncbi:MAG: T9SS type A sorting domain-containing protein [Chitinophagaceae bacterium]|nr:T9SS type A sorting domain-containing protein [Chitinophagaceae bacterium]